VFTIWGADSPQAGPLLVGPNAKDLPMTRKHRNRRVTAKRPARRASTNHQSRHRILSAVGVGLAAVGLVAAGILIPNKPWWPLPETAAVLVWTVPDAQTTKYSLTDLETTLTSIADNHDSVLLVAVDGDGHVTSTAVDMTPRTSGGEILNVPARAKQATREKISSIETRMNEAVPGTQSRAMYVGLLSARIPKDASVYLFSSGIDLTSPVDMRVLDWQTPAQQVIDTVTAAQAVPKLTGNPVTFYLTAPSDSGGQDVRASQTQYLHDLWTALLLNGGASSVSFVDGIQGEPASTQNVPVAPLPILPATPVAPQPAPDHGVTCTLDAVAFEYGTDVLMDEQSVASSLSLCVDAMKTASKVTITGTCSYEGGFDSQGRPLQPDYDQQLAASRATRVESLLISMGIPAQVITTEGFGGVDHLPHPEDPASPLNRVVIIRATEIIN